jgi:hypothetical protein
MGIKILKIQCLLICAKKIASLNCNVSVSKKILFTFFPL